MIPYYKPPIWQIGPFGPIGPLTLEVFGVFVVLGVFVGAKLASIAAQKRNLDDRLLADFALWGVAGGVIGGHLVHLFLYHPEELSRGGFVQVLKVWEGLSSFGGLLGAIIAAAIFFRMKGASFSRYGDALALGVAPGWGVARLGCFAVHDHPGVLTDFPLAVQFPGGARHDLGLYDAIALFAFTAVLYVVASRGKLTARLLPLLALMYGISRFFLDFLRQYEGAYVDRRYLGLTPAQYGCFLLVAYGLYGLWRKLPPAATPQVQVGQKAKA